MLRVFGLALVLLQLWALPAVASDDLWRDFFPSADRLGPVEGQPPAASVYAGPDRLGWVFSSFDATGSLGYGGKKLDLMIGLDVDGIIVGSEITEQQEPIMATGATGDDLARFARQFVGRDVRDNAQVMLDPGSGGVDAVSGATITSLVIHDAIMEASRAVARTRHIIDTGGIDLDGFEPMSWPRMVEGGLVTSRELRVGEVREALTQVGGRLFPPAMGEIDGQDRLVTIHAALATPAMAGRNLLGSELFERVRAELPVGTHLVLVGGAGRWSFKGTAWRKSGRFERLAIIQDGQRIELLEDMHRRIDGLVAKGVPDLREIAMFTIGPDLGFRADRPWQLELTVSDHADPELRATFALDYILPGSLQRIAAQPLPLWLEIWLHRKVDIAILTIALLILTTVLVLDDVVSKRPLLWQRLRLGFLTFTLFWLGWYATAQLSVVNVLTFADALRTDFRWDFFLLEPLIFILWSYVAVVIVFWGRGVFCGWLCPFGALQELTNMLAKAVRIPQFELPFALHERLRAIKFVIFLALVAVALGSMAQAQRMVEVEPFKTAIVLHFARAWPFVAYAVAILIAGLFVRRVFCRYLCPLGAALALPARLRQFEWLKRRHQCGERCHICATTCPVRAIQPTGEIHPGECIYCLRCQINYHDEHTCPPLIERRKRRDARAAARATSQ